MRPGAPRPPAAGSPTTAPRPDAVAYRDAPLGGEIAFVFTNGSAAYPGMGAELVLAFPDLADAFEASHARLRPRAGEAQAALSPPGVIGRILGAAVLCAFHAEFTRGLLRIQPDAAIGYSSGESAALVALGAWTDPAALNHDVQASELLATDLTGEFRAVRRAWRRLGVTGERWVSYLVSAPADQVRAALGDQAAAYLMAINAPDACIIGGEESACEAVLRRLAGVAVIPIDYGIAAHAPVLADVAEEYRRLHWRPTADLPGVRFYSGATGESYRASADRAADALAAQILGPIDFVRVIERAWADGVRVFVEHGPQAQCTGWIRQNPGRPRPPQRRARRARRPGHPPAGLRSSRSWSRRVWRSTRRRSSTISPRLLRRLRPGPRRSGCPPIRPRCGCPDANHRWPSCPGRRGWRRWRTASSRTAPSRATPARAGPSRAPAPAPSPGVPRRRRTRRRTPHRGAGRSHRSAGCRSGRGQPRAAGAPAGVADLVARQFQNVTALHRDFLAKQAQAHAEFLRARQQGVSALIAMMPGERAEAERPSPVPVDRARLSPSRRKGRRRPHPPPRAPGRAAAGRGPGAAPLESRVVPCGPTFDRAQLEWLAEGRISELFGPQFAAQDDRPRQTRMPSRPCCWPTGSPASTRARAPMGTGTIWTETDVAPRRLVPRPRPHAGRA